MSFPHGPYCYSIPYTCMKNTMCLMFILNICTQRNKVYKAGQFKARTHF